MIKALICLLTVSSVFSLHLNKLTNKQNHLQTNGTINMPASFSNLDLIINKRLLINNQLSTIQKSRKTINDLPDILMIGPQGTLIKCKNIALNDQENIQSALDHVATDIWSLYFQLQKYMNHGGNATQQVQKYQGLKIRKNGMKIQPINYCPILKSTNITETSTKQNLFANVTSHKFVSNLSGGNWVYGNISKAEYQIKQFQLLLAHDVIHCIQKTPFAINNNCINCKDGQIFFLDTQTCSKCPSSTTFDAQSHSCLLNSNSKCNANLIYSINSKQCQCPSGLPYLDGQNCIMCILPNYWNTATQKCQSCSSGSYYSLEAQKCQPCPSGFISSLSSCHQTCSLTHPFFNGQSCLNCPQIFNGLSKQCQVCANNLLFNKEKGICANQKQQKIIVKCQPGYILNKQNDQCLKNNQPMCPDTYVFNQSKNACVCPDTLPFDTGSSCISCKLPNFWNKDTKKCASCGVNAFYDSKSSKCIKCPVQKPNLLSNNTCGNCPLNTSFDQTLQICRADNHYCPPSYVWSNAMQICLCPDDKPISTELGCSKQCLKGEKMSTSLNTCVYDGLIPMNTDDLHICKEAQIWNDTLNKCLCIPYKPYMTNQGCVQCYAPMVWSTDKIKCIFPGNSSGQSIVNGKKCSSNFIYNQTTKTCVCLKQTPFNSGSQCVSCYLPMYWNVIDKICKYCPTNQVFNTMTRQCEYCPALTPLLVNNVCQQCPQGQKFNQVSFKCEKLECSGESVYSKVKNDCLCVNNKTPFFNGQKCVSCLAPNRWDLNSRTCVANKVSNVFSTINNTVS